MTKFSVRLKELRAEKELSQQELGNIIGVSKSSINMYERGEREPGLETLEALADFFNVDMDYLMGRQAIKKLVDVSKHIDKNSDLSHDDFFSKISVDELFKMLRQESSCELCYILKSVRSRKLDFSESNVIGYTFIKIDPFINSIEDEIWGDCFSIYAKDDSMADVGIYKNNLLVFDTLYSVADDEDDEFDLHSFNNSIVLASINNKEPIVRKLIIQKNNLVILEAHNEAYLSQAFSEDEFKKVEIIGKLIRIQKGL